MAPDDVLEAGQKAYRETSPDKLDSLSDQDLESYYQAMSKLYPHLDAVGKGTYWRRIEWVKREIQHRRTEERSVGQHRQLFGKAKWTLFWAAVGGVTGIVLVLVAIVPDIYRIYFSKIQHATPTRLLPSSPLQSQSTTSESPEPEANSSTSTPSPGPTATPTALVSPLESSDNPD